MTMSLGRPFLLLAVGLVFSAWACGGGRTALLAPSNEDVSPRTSVDAGVADAGGFTSQPADGGLCPDGFTTCGKGLLCHDLARSPEHCGSCGNSCAPGLACQAGRCQQARCRDRVTFQVLPVVSTVVPSGDDYSFSLSYYEPVLGDFDRDGILDFIGQTGTRGPMGVLLGKGDGTFRAKPIAAAYAYSWRAAVADLNDDGLLDLASISQKDAASVTEDEAMVTVRMGDGDPSTLFAAGTTYLTPSTPSSLALADLDRDGQVDLVAGGAKDAVAAKAFLRLWRGSASGKFAAPIDLAAGAVGRFLVAADWNRDGALDLLYGTSSLRMLLGRGDGSFDKEVACGLTLDRSTFIANFDSDSRPDVVLCSLGVLLDMNGCNFTRAVSIPGWQVTPSQGGPSAGAAAAADLDGDGKMDLVGLGTVSPTEEGIAVYTGDGRGGFAAPVTFRIPEGQPGSAIVAGDFNRDGKLDLLVARPNGWQVLLNTCR
jgi:hypothetical protein